MNGLSPVVVVVFFIFSFLISFILGIGYELLRKKMKPPPKKKKRRVKKKKINREDIDEDDIIIEGDE